MTNILEYIYQFKEILTALVAIAMFAIISYKQIMAEIKRKEDRETAEARSELTNIVTGLITTAEIKPNKLLQSLTDLGKDKISPIVSDPPAQVKESLVLTALQEHNPSLLKKAKLKDVPAILSFIGNVYQGVKPLVGLLRKK